MDPASSAAWAVVPAQIMFMDLVLGLDNAVLIALVCASLPRAQRGKAMAAGIAAAVLCRALLASAVSLLIALPFLKLAGAALLLLIAFRLVAPSQDGGPSLAVPHAADSWGAAAAAIAVADLVMSLDNVVALSAVSGGNFLWLVTGLAFSIPLLVAGSAITARLAEKVPSLVPCGAALLGWVAGSLALSDPLVADWVSAQAPALQLLLPAACLWLVWQAGRQGTAKELAVAPVVAPALAPVRPVSVPVQKALPPKTPAVVLSPQKKPVPADPGLAASAPGTGRAQKAPADKVRERIVLAGLVAMALVVCGFFAYVLYASQALLGEV